MFPQEEEAEHTRQLTEAFLERLSHRLEEVADGKIRMTIFLPDKSVLDSLARSQARMVGVGPLNS